MARLALIGTNIGWIQSSRLLGPGGTADLLSDGHVINARQLIYLFVHSLAGANISTMVALMSDYSLGPAADSCQSCASGWHHLACLAPVLPSPIFVILSHLSTSTYVEKPYSASSYKVSWLASASAHGAASWPLAGPYLGLGCMLYLRPSCMQHAVRTCCCCLSACRCILARTTVGD